MSKIIKALLLLCLSSNVLAQRIQVVTEDLPPLQISSNTKAPSGAMVELVTLLMTEANLPYDLHVYPWARAYDQALKDPHTVIFSILRSESRENDFHWIGHIYTIKSYLAALESRADIKVSSLEEAKHYIVGSIRHDLAESYLLNKGFVKDKNLYVSAKYPILWNMLFSGRTDLAFTNSIIWQHEVAKTGLNPEKLSLVYEVKDFSSDLYIAANKEMDAKIVRKLINALTVIKQDGRYQQLLAKWAL